MKKIIASLLLMSSAISMNAAVNVNRIEPTDWYVGMKDASLQLMVYGKDIKNADVTVDYPGVKVDSIARLDSPNYLLVYLNLDGAKAGEMTLNFKQGKQSKKVKYVLKNREMAVIRPATVQSLVCAMVATWRESASTWIILTSWV